MQSCKSYNKRYQSNQSTTNLSKTYYKEIQASHFITPRFMSLDDEIIVDLKTKGLILDFVSKTQNQDKQMHLWNKLYYQNLPHHYLKMEALQQGADILGINGENALNVTVNWPLSISNAQYQQLYDSLQVDIVACRPIRSDMKGKYTFTPNPAFWEFTTPSNYPLLVDILSTYERDFEAYEIIHSDIDQALDYAVIIFDALCNQRNPDNSYYYNTFIGEQLSADTSSSNTTADSLFKAIDKTLPLFNINMYSKDRAQEYLRIMHEQREDLEITKAILTQLTEPPFYIVNILED